MRVTELHVYPVKSMGGTPVEVVSVESQGFAGDRRWAVVDDAGGVVTAREARDLLRLTAQVVDADTIRITDRADGASILVETPVGVGSVPIGLSRMASAAPVDDDVNHWLRRRVGRAVRLVWQDDPASRPVSAAHGGQPGDTVSMADAGPVLLASESSLARLNDWIEAEADVSDPANPADPADPADPALEDPTGLTAPPGRTPLPVSRFRPNVVIDGEAAFAEDHWTTLRIGSVDFRVSELCDRCVMTTVDYAPSTAGRSPSAPWRGTGAGTARPGSACA